MRSSRTSLKIFHAGHLIIHYPFDLIDQPVNNANQWRLQWRGLETGAASLQAPLPQPCIRRKHERIGEQLVGASALSNETRLTIRTLRRAASGRAMS
jgi:hypothetical protein